MAGQSITDRIMAAQHTIIGSEMSKIVCKASTHEIMGPKKKHLDYLNALTHEPNINIPELADFLIERSKQQSWVVVFKALITTHHLMCYGNERFIQHLASRNSLFNLVNFLDKSGVQGYDMSTFIRRYSKYLNEKAVSYRTVAYDFTRAKRGKDVGILRTLPTDKLLKTLPVLQTHLDALLAFDANANELSNGVINSCFMLLFKDSIRLFASYNDGVINLLEKYFDMKKPQCKESLDIYKKFLTRMSKVSEFFKIAELVGIDKGDIPDLAQAPNSLLDALEQHYNALDGKKGASKPSEATTAQLNSFTAASSTFSKFDDKQTQETLKEEEERLEAFKAEKLKQQQQVQAEVPKPVETQASSGFSVNFNNTPAAPAPASTSNNSLFDLESVFTTQQQPIYSQPGVTNAAPLQAGFDAFSSSNSFQSNNLFDQQPFTAQSQPQTTTVTNLFPQNNTQNPFSDATSTPFQGDLLTPTVFNSTTTANMMPQSNSSGNLNLDSSLADLANLNLASGKANKDFQPKTQKKMTGGANYQPKVAAGTTIPMNSNMPAMNTTMPAMNTTMPTMNTAPNPMYSQMGMPMQMNPMMVPTAGQMGMQAGYNPMMQPSAYNQQMMLQSQQMRQVNPNNPFGAM